LALDEPKENEEIIQVNSIDVLISDVVKNFVDGSMIDYVNLPDGEGFVIAPAGGSYC